MRGIQCPKSLYLTINHPELEPPSDPSQQALFDQGHEVGIAAQKKFPGGVTITAPYFDTQAAFEQTEDAIQKGATNIYEATFSADGVTAKIDILHRESSSHPWQIIEVKSTTSVKEEHLTDVAIQSLVMDGTKHKHKDVFLMHINNQVKAPDLENLFTQVSVSAEIDSLRKTLPTKIEELKAIVSKPETPKTEIGPHCDDPYECPFKAHCWQHIPKQSVFELPAIGKKAWEYYEKGIIKIADPKFIPSKSQLRRVEAVRSGVRWVDSSAIGEALSTWKWPLIYLDFETIAFAIPRYTGTRPYEQIPFQFSCLKQTKPGQKYTEAFYLHDSEKDPRAELIPRLLEALEEKGSIVAYNMGFESGCLERLAAFSPEHSKQLLAAKERLVDPLPIFRAAVYDSEFSGSFSIKHVAPAILGADRTYDGMTISDGGAAQRGFLALIGGSQSEAEREQLTKAMLAYCKKDTVEMLDLVEWLHAQVSSPTPARKASGIK